ncbi:AMP-binding protein [Virgisporangium aurantiacum]|uniref:Long-chain-fatty-acid--CoA ligase n=1 Tax=Virgisporangium aurantiacum TaxID=175570 RepID=A0A8J4E6D8_9ACTN|nr:AMP-binding protein [Virgisporangium aurantiacum]GIJ63129.1 long-chain-fatty-acid--CoA ligase [Virgisporangium aurantiacum]
MESIHTVPDLLRRWVRTDPDRVALAVDGGGTLTYRGWEERSNAVAHGLLGRGLRPGDAAALLFDNREWIEYAVAYLGVLKVGGIAVPLSGRMTEPELALALDHCTPVGLVHAGRRTVSGVSGWVASVADLVDDGVLGPVPGSVRPGDICEVLYTSGTTGRPKGVASTHQHSVRPLVEAPHWYPERWAASAGRTYLHANSIGSAAGQLRLLEPLGPLGMTTLALPVFDAERFCTLLAEHRVAVVQLVPTMALTILDIGAHERHDLSGVQTVVFGCAPLPASAVPDLARAFPAATLVNMYELSEARHVGTYAVCGDGPNAAVGRPRGATEVRITGSDGREVSRGEIGEIRLRWAGLGPHSYYRDPSATDAVFGDGWTRTGDAGRLDEHGHLTLVDRLKDVIISAGQSISSVEIEDVLFQHPAVSEAVVFGLPHRIHGEEVAAAVVLNDGGATVEQVRAFVADRLSRHKVPRLVFAVEAIPRNRNGKPLKRELRDRFGSVDATPTDATTDELPDRSSSAKASEPDRERVVRALWSQVLGTEPGPNDNFFDLGGDSVRASQLAARICDEFGVRLTVGELFEHPTVGAVADLISDVARAGRPAPPPIRRLPRVPLTQPRSPS